MIDPGIEFSPVGSKGSTLRIGFRDERYWIYDHQGFLVSVDTIEEVKYLIELESGGTCVQADGLCIPYYWKGARESLYPGSAERWLRANMKKFIESAPKVKTKSAPLVDIDLAALGLE